MTFKGERSPKLVIGENFGKTPDPVPLPLPTSHPQPLPTFPADCVPGPEAGAGWRLGSEGLEGVEEAGGQQLAGWGGRSGVRAG